MTCTVSAIRIAETAATTGSTFTGQFWQGSTEFLVRTMLLTGSVKLGLTWSIENRSRNLMVACGLNQLLSSWTCPSEQFSFQGSRWGNCPVCSLIRLSPPCSPPNASLRIRPSAVRPSSSTDRPLEALRLLVHPRPCDGVQRVSAFCAPYSAGRVHVPCVARPSYVLNQRVVGGRMPGPSDL